MEIDKWEEVLIQWINCLKLTDTIADIESLRNGEFFMKLLGILEPENLPIKCEDCLTCSLELIKTQYPNYTFDKEYVTDLSCVSLNNIVTICSLLLHYACVIEKKDSLIVPSCNKLPPDIQINIKNFLEKVNSKITNFHFKKIIDEMNEFNISSNSYQWIPIGDSPLIGKSPLQEFLRSPCGRKITIEKGKEIQKLKSALEIERFEKADLLEEIKEHKEQIKKLGNQIKEKSNQISKLRSELYSIENRTPPHNIKSSSIDIERQLKLEIQHLEQYIEQLQLKQDDLQVENINTSEKLRSLGEESRIWKQTAQTLELNNKELMEKFEKQELELENIKQQCGELTAILEETRTSNTTNDSSLFLSPSSNLKRRSMNDTALPYENLAHTIIDVQLKDSQKENEDLKNLLKESVDEGNTLKIELANTKRNYQHMEKKFSDVEADRNNLLQQISDLKNVCKELEQLKRQVENELEQISISNSNKDSLITSLTVDLKKSTDLSDQYEKLYQNVGNDLEQLKAEFVEREELIIEKDTLYESLRQEADLLQFKYDESVEKFNKTNFDMESLKANYEQFAKNLEKSLTKLEITVYGCNEMKFDDIFFENVIERLKFDKNNANEEISKLKRSLGDCEVLADTLKRDISRLKDKEELDLQERENLKNLLYVAEVNIKELERTIAEQNSEIDVKTNKITELSEIIKELRKTEQIVAEKNTKIKDLEEISVKNQLTIESQIAEGVVMNENVQKLRQNIIEIEKNLAERDEDITNLKRENSNLNEKNGEVLLNMKNLISTHVQEIMEQEKLHLEKIHVCNLQMQEYSDKIERLEVDLKITSENSQLKCRELDELTTAKHLMEDNYTKVNEDLQRKVEITEETIKKLEIELSIVKSEKNNLEEDVKQLNVHQEKLLIEKEHLLTDIRKLKAQLKDSFEKLSNAEDECSQKDTIISENNKELLTIKLNLESKKQEYRNLQEHVEKLNVETLSYKFCIETLNVKNADFQDKIEKLEGKLDVLNNLKTSLEKKHSDLEINMEIVMSKLAIKNEEINDAMEKLSEEELGGKMKMADLQNDLEEARENMKILEEEKVNIIDKNEREITVLKQEISRLNDKIYELNAKEIDYIQEIQVIKSELNVAFEKYTQSFDEQQELKSDHEAQLKNLTENLHEIVANYNRLEKIHQKDVEELENVNAQLEKLKEENIALEVKIVDQKKRYDQEIDETNEQFNLDFKQLKSKHSDLEQLLVRAKSDLEQQKGIQFRLENDVKKLFVKIGEIELEKAELLKKIESLEETKFKLEDDYKSLKLTHEKYILETETNLKLREEQYIENIRSVEIEKGHLMEQIKQFEVTISSLLSEKEAFQGLIDDTRKKYEDHILDLQNKTEQLQCTNSRIVDEQSNLKEKILNYDQQNHDRSKFVEAQTETISKLKSACDILQTGKERVELDLKNIQDLQKKLQTEQVEKEIQANEKLLDNEEKLRILREDLDKHKWLVSDKDIEISELTNKLSDLHTVNEALKNEADTLEERLEQSTECHAMFLNKIDEENLQAINDMLNDFVLLKTKYEEISFEIISIREQRKELRERIENSSKNLSELQKSLESKGAIVEELNNRIAHAEENIAHKEIVVKELTEELADTVNNLVSVKHDKLKLEVDLEEAFMEIDRLKKSREEILESQHKIIKDTEDNILRAHANAIDVKNDLLRSIENAKEEVVIEKNERLNIQKLLDEERAGVKFLEIEVLNIKREKAKHERICNMLKKNLQRLYEILDLKMNIFDDNINIIEEEKLRAVVIELQTNIADTYRKSRELTDLISLLQDNENDLKLKLTELEHQKSLLHDEKIVLLADHNTLIERHRLIVEQRAIEKEEMQNEIGCLISKLEENSCKANDVGNLKTENEILHQTVISLKDKNVKAYNTYNAFAESSKTIKIAIDKILKDRSSLESLVSDLRRTLISVQMKCLHLNRESKHYEQKESLEFIVEDILKQFNRYSKIAYNLAYNNVQVSEKVVQGILSEKYVDFHPFYKDLNIDEVTEKLEELRDRSSDTLEQLKSMEEVLAKNEVKTGKTLKENVPRIGSSSQLSDLKKEEEWRKKYSSLRQKLTLTENVKNNYEKKVKQLREENKRLASEPRNLNEDGDYKILLQQHVQTKEDFEKKVTELKTKYQKLQSEYVELKKKQKVKPEVENLSQPVDSKSEGEIQAIKVAYGKVISENSKLELDNATLRKLIDDKNNDLTELSLVREAYEKLLEENSKMMTEVDTLKYKRSRDKEDFIHLLKKDREEREGRENKKIQQIRTEYEGKLESMKAKMLNLYKEELDKETNRLTVEKHNYDLLKLELNESKRAMVQLKMTQKFDMLGSRESLGALSVKSECDTKEIKDVRGSITSKSRGTSGTSLRSGTHDRRYATMPRSMAVIEESNRASINSVPPDLGQNLEMEDEDELFNNKYLTDLKEGHCVVGKNSDRTGRMSELAWRNSLYPPHLKSSYPAEMQFTSPSRFKEDDIKAGNIEFDDSMSTKLLPGEKGRKKDIGTTSYKKPGPPTPSKNGGRLSLQSNEIQLSKDVQDLEVKTPKKTTPSRLKAFFLALNSNSKNSNSENQAGTPKPKPGPRIFRKQR